MRYTSPDYSRNDFGVVSRYQCPVESNVPYQRNMVAMAVVNDRQVPVARVVPTQVKLQHPTPIAPTYLVPMINQSDNIEETEDVDWARVAAEEAATARVVKSCPWCGKATYLIDGCNYMKCSQSDPISNCAGEWCFQCLRPKYNPIPGKEWLGCCNEQSHNSH